MADHDPWKSASAVKPDTPHDASKPEPDPELLNVGADLGFQSREGREAVEKSSPTKPAGKCEQYAVNFYPDQMAIIEKTVRAHGQSPHARPMKPVTLSDVVRAAVLLLDHQDINDVVEVVEHNRVLRGRFRQA